MNGGASMTDDLRSRIRRWDEAWFYRINGWDTPFSHFLRRMTNVGSSVFWTVLVGILFVLSWLLKLWVGWMIVKLFIANTTSVIVVLLAKLRIRRVRPCYVLSGVIVRTSPRYYRGSAFPSGHTQFFVSNMLVVTTVLASWASWTLVPMLAVTILASAMVALSRVHVGVHYPTDVIAGLITGALIYCLTIAVVYPFIWSPIFAFLDHLIHLMP
jgi:undecaprenyl-diphosphatase